MIVYDDLRQVFENNKIETAEYTMLEDKIFDLAMQAELSATELDNLYLYKYGQQFYKVDKSIHQDFIKYLQGVIKEQNGKG